MALPGIIIYLRNQHAAPIIVPNPSELLMHEIAQSIGSHRVIQLDDDQGIRYCIPRDSISHITYNPEQGSE